MYKWYYLQIMSAYLWSGTFVVGRNQINFIHIVLHSKWTLYFHWLEFIFVVWQWMLNDIFFYLKHVIMGSIHVHTSLFLYLTNNLIRHCSCLIIILIWKCEDVDCTCTINLIKDDLAASFMCPRKQTMLCLCLLPSITVSKELMLISTSSLCLSALCCSIMWAQF